MTGIIPHPQLQSTHSQAETLSVSVSPTHRSWEVPFSVRNFAPEAAYTVGRIEPHRHGLFSSMSQEIGIHLRSPGVAGVSGVCAAATARHLPSVWSCFAWLRPAAAPSRVAAASLRFPAREPRSSVRMVGWPSRTTSLAIRCCHCSSCSVDRRSRRHAWTFSRSYLQRTRTARPNRCHEPGRRRRRAPDTHGRRHGRRINCFGAQVWQV